MRTKTPKTILAGYGALTKSIVNTFVNDVESLIFAGVAVNIDGPRLLYAKVWRMLADGAALAMCFDSNMSSGTKNCFECSNAIKKGTFDENFKEWVPITCTDMKKFVRHTNESVWKSCDDLLALAPGCGKTRMKQLQQCYGFKHNPHGILACKELRQFIKPMEFITQDWAHIFAQTGVGNIQLYHALESMRIDVNTLQDDVNKWTLPKFRENLQRQIPHFFQPTRRDTKKKYWKSSISEFLTVVPMISNFFLVRVNGFRVDIELFTQLRFILDLIRAMKQGNMRLIPVFRKAVQKHFEGIVKRYGAGIVIPKNHLAAAHLPDQYEADKIVVDTMPVERLHQVPKGFGSSIKKRSRLREVGVGAMPFSPT